MRFISIVVLLNAYLLAAAPSKLPSSILALSASPTPPPPIPAIIENEKRAPKSSPKSPDAGKKTPTPTPKNSPQAGGKTPTPTPKSSPKQGGKTPTPTPQSSPKRGGQTPTPSPRSSPKVSPGKSTPTPSPTPTPTNPDNACKKGRKRMVKCNVDGIIKERYLIHEEKAAFDDDLELLELDLSVENGQLFRILNKVENIQAWLNQEKKLKTWNDMGSKFTLGQRKEQLAKDFQEDEFILEQWTSSDGKTLILSKFFNKKNDLYRGYTQKDLDNDHDRLTLPKEEQAKVQNNVEPFIREGLDPDKSILLTDQIMYGWRQSIGKKDPKTVGLNKIVHYWVNMPATCKIVSNTLKTHQPTKPTPEGSEYTEYVKGDAGFDAIVGTIHLRRTGQMMTDYPEVFGKKTITSIRIAPNSIDDSCADIALFLG